VKFVAPKLDPAEYAAAYDRASGLPAFQRPGMGGADYHGLAMLPTKLTAVDPESERALYKVVRRDTMADVPGLILSASEETGLCLLRLATGEAQEYNFGPGGIRIVAARR
jgi:hypothetical protein